MALPRAWKSLITGMGFGLGRAINFNEAVRCINCGSVNTYTRSYLSSFVYPEALYCYDCGINIDALKHDIICENSNHCSKKNLNSKTIVDSPGCCQIPFPNYKYLKKTRKPYFSLKDLKF